MMTIQSLDNRDDIAGSALSVGHRETLARSLRMRRLPDLFYSFLNEEWFAVYNEYVNMDNDGGTNSDD